MEQDFSLPSAIRLVEQVRASGDLFGSFAHRVALDFCLEHGVMLRVTSNRTVPIKKSNPGVRYQHQKPDAKPLASRHRYIDKGKLQRAQPGARPRLAGLAGFPLQQAERPIGESYQFPVDMAMTPENGFTYAGNNREAIRGENAALFGIDAATVGLWAATPTEPMRIGAQDLAFDDHGRHLEQHRLMLASNPTRGASYSGIWYGQRFLEMPCWPWKSDAIFADIREEEARDLRDAWALREAINAPPALRGVAARMVIVDEMADMQLVSQEEFRRIVAGHVDEHRELAAQAAVFGTGVARVSWDEPATRTIEFVANPAAAIEFVANPAVPDGEAYVLPNLGRYAVVESAVRVSNIEKARSESRVPEFLQNTRLDGRRR